MSLFAQFELVMLVLYAVECLAFAPGESVLIVRAFVLRVSVARPWQVMATRRGRVIAAGWMPWDVGLVAAPWPISIADGAVANRPSHALFDERPVETFAPRCLRFDELEAVTFHERELWVNGQRFAVTAGRAQSEELTQLLRRLRDAPPESPEDRGDILRRAMRRHLGDRRAAKRWKRFLIESGVAKRVSVMLALLIFVALPLVYVYLGLENYWRVLIPIYGGLVAMGGLEVDRLYRRLYPKRVGERWKQVLLTIVAPTHAMRLADLVAHELLATHHPAVVARAAGTPRQAEQAARETWLSLHHPRIPPEPDPADVAEVVSTARQRWREALDAWFARHDVETTGWDQAPSRTSPSCVAYCPRCGSQYVEADAGCRACGGLALRPFATPAD